MKIELNKQILIDKFGFDQSEIKKDVGVIGKTTFIINKSINLDRLVEVIKGIIEVLKTAPIVRLNKVKLLSPRVSQHKALVHELEEKLLMEILTNLENANFKVDFDICHSEFEKYLLATGYNIRIGHSVTDFFTNNLDKIDDISFIHSIVTEKALNYQDNKMEIIELLKSIIIISYSSETKIQTKGLLIKHLSGQITYQGKSYFFMEGIWYELEDNFLADLDEECRSIITNCHDNTVLDLPWGNNSELKENEYNSLYFDKDEFLVFDKVFDNNLELFDLIKIDDDLIHLIHVKRGFGNTVRDLTSQIYLSAKRIQSSIRSNNYNFAENLYKSLLSKKDSTNEYYKKVYKQKEKISKSDFKELFKRKIIYCIAIYDDVKEKRNFEDIEKFDSNIAKYSILDLARRMEYLNAELKIIQIT